MHGMVTSAKQRKLLPNSLLKQASELVQSCDRNVFQCDLIVQQKTGWRSFMLFYKSRISPDNFDLMGGGIVLLGVLVMMYAPRS